MFSTIRIVGVIAVLLSVTLDLQSREWTDSSGKYKLNADLVGYDDENVILQREDKQLGSIRLDQLSQQDQEYLKSKEASLIKSDKLDKLQQWTTAGGLTLVGRIVDYTKKDVTVQRRRGKTYVNDRVLENLPEFYQKLFPLVIAHFENIQPTQSQVNRWLYSTRGEPKTFTLEGVVMELENGDEYGIPFFVFSEKDQRVLKQGWSQWIGVKDDFDKRDDEAFHLESLAATYNKNQELNRRIALMQLNMQAVQAGLTSLWEVTLYPNQGNMHPPMWVVYPGRNSEQAALAAMQQHPGFTIGSIRRVSN